MRAVEGRTKIRVLLESSGPICQALDGRRPRMTGMEARNIEAVRRYFDGCSTGDLDTLLGTLAPDVVHYFLPTRFPPIRGAEPLAKYWCKYKEALDPVWSIDRIIAQGDEVVSEWSCIWTSRESPRRLITRGSEWYVVRGGRIAEIRAYFISDRTADTELVGFPYGERGYLVL
jgi:ketosteroid isomerase-like protein